jgi:hypothetical protein
MEEIPSEIRAIIATFLDERSRRMMRLANTPWFNTIHYDDFTFNYTTEEQVPQIFQRLRRYEQPLGLTFEKSKYELKPQDYEEIGQLTQLTKLILNNARGLKTTEDVLFPLTTLTNLEIMDQKLPPKIIQHYVNCKSLSFTFVEFDTLDLTLFSKLENLGFISPQTETNFLQSVPHNQFMTELLAAYIPRKIIDENALTRFPKLKFLLVETLREPDEECINLPHLPHLEDLILSATHVGDGLALAHEKLTKLLVECSQIESSTLAALTNLRHLSLNFSSREDLTIRDLYFLTALNHLEHLALEFYDNTKHWKEYTTNQGQKYYYNKRTMQTTWELPEGASWTKVLRLISAEKLAGLEIRGPLKMNHITKFGNLQSLELLGFQERTLSTEDFETLTNLTKLKLRKLAPQMGSAIAKMTKLKQLHISSCSDNAQFDTFHIEKLVALEELVLFSNHSNLLTTSAIQDLPLTHLSMGWQADDTDMKIVAKITTLQSLILHSTVSDNAVLSLAGLSNLTRLTVNKPNMTGVNLTLLTSLRQLHVSSSEPMEVTENELLQQMPRLYDFALSRFI